MSCPTTALHRLYSLEVTVEGIVTIAMNITLPNVDPLQDSLQYLSRQSMGRFCRLAILNSFWNPPSPFLESRKVPVDTYFEYFEEQCQVALHNWERYDISTLKFCHLVELAEMIREGKSRGELDDHLKSELDGHCQEISEEIIDLTVRLLLMIQIGGFRQALMLGQERISWGDGPLAETLKEHFNCDIVLKESVELDNTFTARNIERIGGIRIVWTANLVDHLRMRDDKSVAIFHHASFLHYQQDCDIFPEGLVQETIRTLSLLLPVDQTDTKNWFLKKQIELHLDSEAARCRPLTTDERRIDKFEFWRDRLVMLKNAFDDAKPRTLRQAWADRRNPSQWYNFWIAGFLILAFTVLLGLIQCIEGALQVYKAYYPS